MNVAAQFRRVAALLLVAGYLSAPVFALDPATAFRDYAIDRWTVDDGLPQLSAHSITQDRTGYIWVGTQTGIARFDGQRFDVFSRLTTGGVDTTDAYHSLSDSKGRLWFGTLHGALLYIDGRFSAIAMDTKATSINGIVETQDGEVLFATHIGVLRYADGALVASAIDAAPSHSLLRDHDVLWIGGVGMVTKSTPAGQTTLMLPAAAATAPVTRLAVLQGALWLGTKTGLYRLRGDVIEPMSWDRVVGDVQTAPFTFAGIESLFVDRDDNLWIGTPSSLYRRLPSGALERIGDEDYVRNAWVVSMFEDREGNLWLGSRTESLFRLWNGWAKLIGMRQGLVDPLIWSVVRDPQGRLVLGSNSNVMRLDADGLHELVSGKQLPNPSAYELNYDLQGRLWIGSRAGLAIYDRGEVRTPAAFDVLANLQINAVVPLADGSVWIGTQGGLYRYRDDLLQRVGASAGGAASRVHAIYPDSNNQLLLGTEAGVRRVRGDVIDTPEWAKPMEGLYVTSISEIKPGLLGLTTRDAGIGLIADQHALMLDIAHGLPTSSGWAMQVVDGQLYVASIDGVWRTPVAHLPDPRSATAAHVTAELVLGRHSGSQKMHCCNGGARARSLVIGDSIWLPGIKGAVELKTKAIVPPALPPSAIVRGLHQGQRWFPADQPISVSAGRRDVEIEFTGISFRNPKNLMFRYRLEGYDQSWHETGTRRSAFYTNLPPGQFQFRVQARLSETVVSENDGVLAFELVPRWHERSDVRVAFAIAAAVLVIFLQLWLTRRYRRRGLLLQALVDERTRALSHANASQQVANQALFHANDSLRSEIQERLSAEVALQQRNAELEALNHKLDGTQSQLLQSEKMASVGQLAAGVAHEINNPIGFVQSNIASLQGYIESIFALLRQYEQFESTVSGETGAIIALRAFRKHIDLDYLRTDISDLIRETSEGITRVVKIVGDLKDFSHVDQAQWQVADLHEGLDSTLNVAAHELKYRAELVKEYGAIPPIECMPFQLNQVFLNLLLNAAQAIDRHGTIRISTGCDADQIWVQIADTGKGIEPAHLGRIFEPFFTTKPIGQGTGLGLSVSYNIVQKHGGTIDVTSEVGVGTTFTIRLPLRTRDALIPSAS